VATEDDVAARAALVRLLGNAARADKPDGLRVAVLGSTSAPKEIAPLPRWAARRSGSPFPEGLGRSSYADWRVELLGMMRAEM
jgi:hypothetical protein